ncbi:Semaphorin-2A [Araneus ventricosus]|uniref:Semaphorin-2A n=1 Tax=Araneus ventricosus TaxID=182803 RepID=A0A4Y2KLY0_ARAVE|nr:Semaphorin-2A [Araneus ventricosus]
MTRTTPELAPPSPNFHTTPVEGCLTGVKFNVHQTQRRDGCSVQSSFEPGHHYHHHFATITITTLPALPSGDAITIEPSNVPNCVSKGKSEHYDCRNHIRVIQPIGDGNRLYVCGTNAHNPMDYVIHANLTRLAKHEYFPGIGDGIAKCPFDPEDNATAVWVEHGNPSGLSGLYSGTVAEFTKADTVIFRTNLYNVTTRMEMHPFKRTIKYDSKWLDSGKLKFHKLPEGSPRIHRIFHERRRLRFRTLRTEKDTGGKNILSKNWASFLKARLNCSIPGEFPFYFNEIQDIYKHPEDDQKFYAVFTTSM